MALESLAPDQRAVVQLVLQQGRTYADLAELLGISEEAVRQRARAGLSVLGADPSVPADEQGQVADHLLGQQDEEERAATRALLERSPRALEWAHFVAEDLEPVARDPLPELPPLPADREPAADPEGGPAEGDGAAEPDRETSKLGGAVLLSVIALGVVAAAVFFFSRGEDEPSAATTSTEARATVTPQPIAQLPLRAANGSDAEGLVQINASQAGEVDFTLVARNLPATRRGRSAYAIWLTGRGREPLRLGFGEVPAASNGTLAVRGPEDRVDPARFTRGLSTYASMVVSRETSSGADEPSRIVLRGSLTRLRRGS